MKNKKLIIHIILFFLTAGIGNVIYLLIDNKPNKSNQTKKVNNYIYYPEIKCAIEPKTLKALERDAKIRIECGNPLVEVTRHGGACEDCKRWEGKILLDDVFMKCIPDPKYELLSNAIIDGLFHKGCRHTICTYFPELEGIKYDEFEE